jgi:hypothetical protein
LTVLERAEHLKRRKEIYEAKYPETKAGVRRAYGMHKALGHDVDEIISPTFVEVAAANLGVSPRTYEAKATNKGGAFRGNQYAGVVSEKISPSFAKAIGR